MKIAEVAWKTDTGRVRENNEDFVKVDRENNIFIIADGMGGAEGGEVASKTAVEHIHQLLVQKKDNTEDFVLSEDEIQNIIDDTNQLVREEGIRYSLEGMGTTLIVAYLTRNILTIIHVGDSRVYKLTTSSITQITEDHSVVEELIRNGSIRPEQARTHRLRHMITRVIGSSGRVEPGIYTVTVEKGDLFLMCTDGLTEMLEDSEILSLVAENVDSGNETICNRLIESANERESIDNISTIFIKA